MPEMNDELKFSKCVDVFDKALVGVSSLLDQETENLNYDDVHTAKSVLYAAIERLGTQAERIIYSQRLLRELFSIVS